MLAMTMTMLHANTRWLVCRLPRPATYTKSTNHQQRKQNSYRQPTNVCHVSFWHVIIKGLLADNGFRFSRSCRTNFECNSRSEIERKHALDDNDNDHTRTHTHTHNTIHQAKEKKRKQNETEPKMCEQKFSHIVLLLYHESWVAVWIGGRQEKFQKFHSAPLILMMDFC